MIVPFVLEHDSASLLADHASIPPIPPHLYVAHAGTPHACLIARDMLLLVIVTLHMIAPPILVLVARSLFMERRLVAMCLSVFGAVLNCHAPPRCPCGVTSEG